MYFSGKWSNLLNQPWNDPQADDQPLLVWDRVGVSEIVCVCVRRGRLYFPKM